MALRLIIGRAGTGKSYRCLAEIKAQLEINPEKNLIYLVPEQASFHAEKKLLSFCSLEATFQATVSSFRRLAWRVLQEVGGGIYPVLNDEGKAMILRHLLHKNKAQLNLFTKGSDNLGLLENLVSTFAEFKAYQIKPADLANFLAKRKTATPEDFSIKIADLALIYEAFDTYIKKQYLDTGDDLDLLAQKVSQSDFLKKAEIWLDGFHGFTPQEYAIIRELLVHVPCVHLTLCLDKLNLSKNLTETDLFYPPWETYHKIMEIAQEVQCQIEDSVFLDFSGPHRYQNEALAFLEEKWSKTKKTNEQKAQNLKLILAGNRRAEVEGTIREIIRLCREKGYRYQDIAIMTRDFTQYESLLASILQEYQIPYFIDKKRSIPTHPLPELIKGALEVVQGGFYYPSLFRYLKTDLVPISRQEVDLIENYSLARGIRGKAWLDETKWLKHGEEFTSEEIKESTRVNNARLKAISGLVLLQESFQAAETIREYTKAFYDFLVHLRVNQKLENWSFKAESEGRVEEAFIHSQLWGKIIDLMDQIVQVLGEQVVSAQEFIQILTSGIDYLEIGLIPPGLDQVIIGSPQRSRLPDVKAVFLIGVNDGVFPARVMEEGFFSDQERNHLAREKIILAPNSEKRLFFEQFLSYITLTRASEYLWVSAPLADEEGKSLNPSHLMQKLCECFFHQEDCFEFIASDLLNGSQEEFITRPRPTLRTLAKVLRSGLKGEEIPELWWHVYNWYLNDKEWYKPLESIVKALFYTNREESLPVNLVRKMYGTSLRTSVSRLEKYKACPFAHFLNYGLRLEERAQYKLKKPDVGRFFHAALENVYHSLQKEGLVLGELSWGQLQSLTEKCVDELIFHWENEILISSARAQYLSKKLKRTVLRAIKVLQQHEQRGTFRPIGMEVSFGMKDSKLPGLKIELADGTHVLLQGRIDRIDGAKSHEGYYIRVVDYKSGTAGLSLLEIYYGLKLQLLAYLDVLMTNASELVAEQVRPGGILYFKISDPILPEKGPLASPEIEKRILQELRMKGYLLKEPDVIKMMDQEINGHSDLINAGMSKEDKLYKSNNLLSLEEFDRLRLHVKEVLQEIAAEMMSGNVAIKPYRHQGKSPCQYCTYSAICRFEPGVSGNEYLFLPAKTTAEIRTSLGLSREGDKDVSPVDKTTGNGN